MSERSLTLRFTGGTARLGEYADEGQQRDPDNLRIIADTPAPDGLTPEQRKVVAELSEEGFDIIVHADGAVELSR